ncbi:SAFB-like transcription modulator isoform X2 [Neodiprion pinetum]|uniref:SAFB-like transcription modulator isoform X2 n=1 Tax=Neodiprion pinetum TaxID=441929 RepID=UPI001EE029A6|nr:SAFB-like transcription modulator isoform X2 [Neodiprion pinetum]
MAETEGKKLVELRVIDLKTELERRGLDKTGNKAALLERLSKAITEEGGKPDEYLIVPSGGPNKVIPRKNSVTGIPGQEEALEGSDNRKDESLENQANSEMKIKEETSPPSSEEISENVVKKEVKKEQEEDKVNEGVKAVDIKKEDIKKEDIKMEDMTKVVTKKEDIENEEVKKEEPKEEIENEADEDQNDQNDVDNTVKTESSPPPVLSNPTAVEANGIDNEDSINLTIGEDEENLLAEETETHDRRKDGGEKRTEENKKGDSKGSGRTEGGAGKEGAASANGLKSKQGDGGEGGSKSTDSTAKGQKRDDKDKKTSPSSSINASSRNLWVSGLSSTTRATDLKQVFSKYGKVIGAKVVTNARTPGARCYGYVTMSTSEDAAKCIQHLHRTELHGRVISVEKAKGDSQQSHMRKRDSNSVKSDKKDDKEKSSKENSEICEKNDNKDVKKDSEEKTVDPTTKKAEEKSDATEEKKSDAAEKKDEPVKDSDARSTKSTSKKPESERGKRSSDKRVRSWEHHRSHTRSRSRERRRRDDVLTFAKIREERERQRLRERERILREEERRRREDMERQREIERRQREEAARLEREREKLRRERERIEQEKAELLRLERERQKLEREKLERERLELKRQQMRLEESRRPPPPPSIKRTSSDRRDPRDLYPEPERKRITTEHSRRHSPQRVSDRRTEILERVSDRRLDPSPPSRYESNRSTQDLGLKKDFKRSSEFPSRSSRPDVFPEVTRGREVIVRRETIPAPSSSIDPRQVNKDRYERTTSTTYGREREVRRSETESHRSTRDGHTRYTESTKPPGSTAPRESRYAESSRSAAGWHAGPPSTKSFNSVPSSGPRDPRNEISGWSSRSSENVNRWSSSGSISSTMRHPGPPLYQGGGPMPSMTLAPPGTGPSYDRFDPYKSSMPSMRKY